MREPLCVRAPEMERHQIAVSQMRRAIAIALCLLPCATILAIVLMTETIGDGFYYQEVVCESAKPVVRALFASWEIDEPLRRKLEEKADPRFLASLRPADVKEGRLVARIWFTHRVGLFHDNLYYPPHLVILVEFEDGTRACRVLDVGKERGKKPIVARFDQAEPK